MLNSRSKKETIEDEGKLKLEATKVKKLLKKRMNVLLSTCQKEKTIMTRRRMN